MKLATESTELMVTLTRLGWYPVLLSLAALASSCAPDGQQRSPIRIQRAFRRIPSTQAFPQVEWRLTEQLAASGQLSAVSAAWLLSLRIPRPGSSATPARLLSSGWIPTRVSAPVLGSEGYLVELVDSSGLSRFATRVDLRWVVSSPPSEVAQSVAGVSTQQLDQQDLAIVVPSIGAGARVRVSDPRGLRILDAAVGFPAPLATAAIPFKTLYGRSSLGSEAGSTLAPAAFFDIAVTADDLPNDPDSIAEFESHVAGFLHHFTSMAPLNARASQIRVHAVVNTSVDLGCHNVGTGSRVMACNGSAVGQVIAASGAPHARGAVLVIAYSKGGGTSYNYGICGGGALGAGETAGLVSCLSHELGHSAFGLRDEYASGLDANTGVRPESHEVMRNCFESSTAPAAAWEGLVGPRDYTLKCGYALNFLRPSSSSLMADRANFLNAPSQAIVGQRLSDEIGTDSDAVPPRVSFSGLQEGSVLPAVGEMYLEVNARDGEGTVARVKLYVDGAFDRTSYLPPFKFKVKASEFPSASARVRVEAVDVAGNAAFSEEIGVSFTGPADRKAPTLKLISHVDGETVRGTVELEARATDPTGIETVMLEIGDEDPVHMVPGGTYTYRWNSREYAGAVPIVLRAWDGQGNKRVRSYTLNVR